jgi:anaerobic selenocysteine-containing dehydrogenase
MDESAARADLILPLPTRLERWDDLIAAPELQYPIYNLTRPLIEPRYGTRNSGDILIGIAKKLGATIAESFPWSGVREVLEVRVRGLYEAKRGTVSSAAVLARIEQGLGVSPEYSSFAAMWQNLLESSCWYDPEYEYGHLEKMIQTPSGNFEFFSRELQKSFEFTDETKYMPHYEAPEPTEEGFDLLILPEDMLLMADDGKYTPPFSIKQLGPKVIKGRDLYVKINPITAMYRGLKEDDEVILESPKGKVKVRLHVFEGIREGVVLIPLGFGHTAYDDCLSNKGVNANDILETTKDGITGLPLWGATPGRVTNV